MEKNQIRNSLVFCLCAYLLETNGFQRLVQGRWVKDKYKALLLVKEYTQKEGVWGNILTSGAICLICLILVIVVKNDLNSYQMNVNFISKWRIRDLYGSTYWVWGLGIRAHMQANVL